MFAERRRAAQRPTVQHHARVTTIRATVRLGDPQRDQQHDVCRVESADSHERSSALLRGTVQRAQAQGRGGGTHASRPTRWLAFPRQLQHQRGRVYRGV